MSNPTIGIGFSATIPAATTGDQICVPRGDNGNPLEGFTFQPQRASATLFGTVKLTVILGSLECRFLAADVNKPITFVAPYDGTITSGGLMYADVSGSSQITISKSNAASYPTFTSIVASAPATLVSQLKNTSVPETGWTLSFSKGDIFQFNLDSITTQAWVFLNLPTTRN